MTINWTRDQRDRLRHMRDKGMSSAEAASEFGISRSAVLGAAHRLLGGWGGISRSGRKALRENASGACGRGAKKAPTKPHTASTGRKSTPNTRPSALTNIVALRAPPPSVHGGVRLEDLTARSCRWPLGDPTDEEFRFCGCMTTSAGDPYCTEHAALAMPKPMRGAA